MTMNNTTDATGNNIYIGTTVRNNQTEMRPALMIVEKVLGDRIRVRDYAGSFTIPANTTIVWTR